MNELDKSQLRELISQYANPELGSLEHQQTFEVISSYFVATPSPGQQQMTIQELICCMEPELSSTDDKIRNRSTLLLAELLHTHPENRFSGSSIHLFVLFFCKRLADYPSILPSLHALGALVANHGSRFEEKYFDFAEIFQSVVKELHVQSYAQSIRRKVFELFALLFSTPAAVAAGRALGRELLEGLLTSFEGEKDPRCLLLSLRLMNRMEQLFQVGLNDAALAERLFEISAAYFPITFQPPPDDPHGITTELLTEALSSILTGHEAILRHVVPFLLEQLISDLVLGRVQAMQLIGELVCRYSPAVVFQSNQEGSLVSMVGSRWGLLKLAAERLWLNCADSSALPAGVASGASSELRSPDSTESAAYCIYQINSQIGGDPGGKNTDEWQCFGQLLVTKSFQAIVENVDGLKAREANRVLCALISSSTVCAGLVLGQSMAIFWPKISNKLEQTKSRLALLSSSESSHTVQTTMLSTLQDSTALTLFTDELKHLGAKLAPPVPAEPDNEVSASTSLASPGVVVFVSALRELNPLRQLPVESIVREFDKVLSALTSFRVAVDIATSNFLCEILRCLSEILTRSSLEDIPLELLESVLMHVTTLTINENIQSAVTSSSVKCSSPSVHVLSLAGQAVLQSLAALSTYQSLLAEITLPILHECLVCCLTTSQGEVSAVRAMQLLACLCQASIPHCGASKTPSSPLSPTDFCRSCLSELLSVIPQSVGLAPHALQNIIESIPKRTLFSPPEKKFLLCFMEAGDSNGPAPAKQLLEYAVDCSNEAVIELVSQALGRLVRSDIVAADALLGELLRLVVSHSTDRFTPSSANLVMLIDCILCNANKSCEMFQRTCRVKELPTEAPNLQDAFSQDGILLEYVAIWLIERIKFATMASLETRELYLKHIGGLCSTLIRKLPSGVVLDSLLFVGIQYSLFAVGQNDSNTGNDHAECVVENLLIPVLSAIAKRPETKSSFNKSWSKFCIQFLGLLLDCPTLVTTTVNSAESDITSPEKLFSWYEHEHLTDSSLSEAVVEPSSRPSLRSIVASKFSALVVEGEDSVSNGDRSYYSKAWRQRVWSCLQPWLQSRLRSEAIHEEVKVSYYLALCGLAGGMNASILCPSDNLLGLVLKAFELTQRKLSLLTNSGTADSTGYIELQSQSLSTIKLLLLEDMSRCVPQIVPLIPLLLEVAKHHSVGKTRADALDCLSAVAHSLLESNGSLSYAQLHIYKKAVLNELRPVLDDRKRVVRRKAGKVRNEWFVLGQK